VKSLAKIFSADREIILVGNNSGKLEAYQLNKNKAINIPVKSTDACVVVHKKNGQSYRQEFYFGSNYLSQTSRMLQVDKDVTSIIFMIPMVTKGNKLYNRNKNVGSERISVIDVNTFYYIFFKLR
jgi:hypothetical protein